ncbi:MAG: hypothetical protein FWF08_02870 [Oscillospiraceae bacterium]|nr:hypothetical protein [Oscillospiraceae bacterium]
MSTQKQELFDIIETLPEELSCKVIDYVEYLKFAYIMSEINAPSDLVIKSKEDLIQKLEEGMKDTESGNVCSLDEAFAEIGEILAK